MSARRWLTWLLLSTLVVRADDASPAPSAASTLREAAGDRVLIGCAASSRDVRDPALAGLIVRHFNALTADNEMMPSLVVDENGRYTFERGDAVAGFAAEHRLAFFGQMLLWHHFAPKWLFEDSNGQPLPRARALANLERFVRTVTAHYRGRVRAWDVVNEALSDREGEYLRDTPARRAIGDDYIVRTFEFAQAAAPEAALYYNDYNIEEPAKRAKALRLLRELRSAGVRVDAVGIQGHWLLNWPPPEMISAAVRAFHEAGFKVMVTELDVDVLPRTVSGANLETVEEGPNPYPNGLPADVQQRFAERYGEIFDALLTPPGVTMITFWGTHDGSSWLNDFPVKRRTNHPLLFDRSYRPKPAFRAVLEALRQARERTATSARATAPSAGSADHQR